VTARVRALLLVAALPLALAWMSVLPARAAPPRSFPVYVVRVDGATLGGLLADAGVASLAHAGGAGWASPALDVRVLLEALGPARREVGSIRVAAGRGLLSGAMASVRSALETRGDEPGLVVVVADRPAAATVDSNDELRPLVVATGTAGQLFRADGVPRAVTSDSTRRTGVVAPSDVLATIDAFLGLRGADLGGHEIRFVDEPPPFELHERYVAMRRMTVPIQTAAALYVTLAGLFGLVVLWLGRRAPVGLGVLASGTAISVGPLAAALLLAGHLPTLSYATVVPFVIVVTAFVAGLVLVGGTRDVLHPILPLGLALLAFLLVEDVLGWTAALTPFLGGSELDGGRFFGLPNVFIGLLLGASLYAASRLRPASGFGVLVGAALFAGMPFAGANLGGAVTLLAAAGLWLPVRARGHLDWRGLAFAATVVVAGTAVVLVAHRLSPLPTHVTTFQETRGAAGVLSTFVDRLGVGWRLIVRNPFALAPVLGVLAMLLVMWRPPAVVVSSLNRHPAWRDALLVLSLANVVAYLVNDSGAAACGVGFGMALGGLVYVSVAERTWKMAPA
jgi:hypothetical protein